MLEMVSMCILSGDIQYYVYSNEILSSYALNWCNGYFLKEGKKHFSEKWTTKIWQLVSFLAIENSFFLVTIGMHDGFYVKKWTCIAFFEETFQITLWNRYWCWRNMFVIKISTFLHLTELEFYRNRKFKFHYARTIIQSLECNT